MGHRREVVVQENQRHVGKWHRRRSEAAPHPGHLLQVLGQPVRATPAQVQLSVRIAFESRWWALLSIAQQDSLAATLVDDGVLLLDGHDAAVPLVTDVVVDVA